MFSTHLFFGFPVDPIFSAKLKQADPGLIKEFIQEDGKYLCEQSYNGIRYLGKPLGSIVGLSQMELLESNIYSFLRRLVPDFPYEEASLYLISRIDDSA